MSPLSYLIPIHVLQSLKFHPISPLFPIVSLPLTSALAGANLRQFSSLSSDSLDSTYSLALSNHLATMSSGETVACTGRTHLLPLAVCYEITSSSTASSSGSLQYSCYLASNQPRPLIFLLRKANFCYERPQLQRGKFCAGALPFLAHSKLEGRDSGLS